MSILKAFSWYQQHDFEISEEEELDFLLCGSKQFQDEQIEFLVNDKNLDKYGNF